MITGWYEINGYGYYFYSTAQYEHTAGSPLLCCYNGADHHFNYVKNLVL